MHRPQRDGGHRPAAARAHPGHGWRAHHGNRGPQGHRRGPQPGGVQHEQGAVGRRCVGVEARAVAQAAAARGRGRAYPRHLFQHVSRILLLFTSH